MLVMGIVPTLLLFAQVPSLQSRNQNHANMNPHFESLNVSNRYFLLSKRESIPKHTSSSSFIVLYTKNLKDHGNKSSNYPNGETWSVATTTPAIGILFYK